METITNFEDWLEAMEPLDFDAIYSLYSAVKNGEEMGSYKCGPSPDKSLWFVTTLGSDLKLNLTTKAREAFLSLIHSRYGDPELSMEGWYQFRRSMAKND